MALLPSKVTVPLPPPFFVPRAEVMAALRAGLQGRLTVVTAGAGYGKTMHLAALIQEAAMPVAWLQVDEQDGDLPRFLAYLRAAVLPSAAEGDAPGRWASAEAAIAEISIAASRRGSLILVLDDLSEAVGTAVTGFLMQLVRHAPPQLHIYVSGRPTLKLPLGRLRAGDQVRELRQGDFLLSQTEAATILGRIAGRPLAPEQMEAATGIAGGWGAGLVLLGVTLGRNVTWKPSPTGLPGEVSSYLWEETWTTLSLQDQQCLEAAFLVGSITPAIAAGLLGEGDWAGCLERLSEKYGILTGTPGVEYWLSPLWNRFLHHRLTSGGNEPHLVERCRRAAPALAALGMPVPAIRLYLRARSYAEASALLAASVPDPALVAPHAALHDLLDEIPPAVLGEHPWLAFMAAQHSFTRGRLDDARGHATTAGVGFRRTDDRKGRVLSAALQCAMFVMAGDKAAAGQVLEEGFAALEPGMDLLRARLLEQRWLLDRASRQPDLDAQEQVLREALSLYRNAPSPQPRHEARVTDRLGIVAMERGQMEVAISLLERSVDVRSALGTPPWESGYNLGVALSAACRFAPARAIFQPMFERSEWPMRRLIAALNLLDIYITMDESVRAQEAARVALELAGQLKAPHLAARVRVELARLYRVQGQHGLAVSEARAALAQAERGADPSVERDTQRALAEAGLWAKPDPAGDTVLPEVAPGSPEWARTAAITALYMLRSRTRKRREDGAELLSWALRELSQHPSFRSYVLRHWDLALTLTVTALAMGVLPLVSHEVLSVLESVPEPVRTRGIRLPDPEGRHLRKAIAALDGETASRLVRLLCPDQRQQLQEAGAPALRVRLLGQFDMRLNGEPLEAKELNQRRAMPLLLTLLVKPEGVSREVLLEWLWPDDDRRKGLNKLRVGLHRLRQIIEPGRQAGPVSPFLCGDGGALRWLSENTQVDLWEVQAGLEAAERALRRKDAPGAALAYEQAAFLYRGPLETGGCLWLDDFKEYLQAQMKKALYWLADYHRQAQPDRAIQYLRQLLGVEPGEEQAVQQLMRLLAQTGRRAEIGPVYQKCCDYLEKHVEVSVSAETKAVFLELTRGARPAPKGHGGR